MCVDRIPVGDSSFACEDFAAFKPWPPAAGDRSPRCCHALPVIARPDAAHALPVIARPDATHALPVIGCQLLAIRSAPCCTALRRHAATLRCAPAPRLPM